MCPLSGESRVSYSELLGETAADPRVARGRELRRCGRHLGPTLRGAPFLKARYDSGGDCWILGVGLRCLGFTSSPWGLTRTRAQWVILHFRRRGGLARPTLIIRTPPFFCL